MNSDRHCTYSVHSHGLEMAEKYVAGLLVVDLKVILAQAQGQLSSQAIHLASKGQCREFLHLFLFSCYLLFS
jgi:hypothetical protein